MTAEEWFSDAALAKQEALKNQAADAPRHWSDIAGIWEARVPAADDERCCRCGLDSRPDAGGDGHFCGIHAGRRCKVPDDCGPHGPATPQGSPPMTIHEAITAAESAAQAAHDAGTCGLSEWSCSACESEAQG